MDDLLDQMSLLADQAGDWRNHLPYAAAVGYLDNPQYRQQYGSHVDNCEYCQQLTDTLNPGEQTITDFLSSVRVSSALDQPARDPASALIEARSDLDAIRHVLVAPDHGAGSGTLRHWANAQRWLADAHLSVDGQNRPALDPWSATVALSLDIPPGPDAANMTNEWIGAEVEQVASFLLAFGYRVAHAGDLRQDGISERLFRLARQYGPRLATELWQPHPGTAAAAAFGVTGYCAWPLHIGMPIEELETYATTFSRSGTVNFLTLNGEPHPYTHFSDSARHNPAPAEWTKGLSTLRNTMVHDSFARVAIRGDTAPAQRMMPSLAQDALLSLEHQQPLYILAGFGGCARDVALALHLTETAPSTPQWQGIDQFAPYIGVESLHNGLDAAENQSLADTDDIDEAIRLVLLGLNRVSRQQHDAA